MVFYSLSVKYLSVLHQHCNIFPFIFVAHLILVAICFFMHFVNTTLCLAHTGKSVHNSVSVQGIINFSCFCKYCSLCVMSGGDTYKGHTMAGRGHDITLGVGRGQQISVLW